MLPISSTIALKPPACSSKSVTRNACSIRGQGFPETTGFRRGADCCGVLGSKTSRSGFILRCGSAHRGAVTSGLRKPLTASESPLTSLRGCGPKPPPCRPFLIGGGMRDFSGSAKPSIEVDLVFVDGGTPQRTQSRRDRSTPVAAADSGSKAFETSTQAQTFPACVIWLKNDIAN